MNFTIGRLRLIGLFVLAVAVILGMRFFELPRCASFVSYFEAMDWHASLCFFVAYVVATITFLPGALLTLVAGMAFGTWHGLLVVMASAAAGVTLTFFITRFLARARVEAALEEKLWFQKLRQGLEHGGLSAVLITRLVPIFPYNGLNYALGLFPLRTRDYVAGSVIGMLPGALTYTYIGAVIGCAYLDAKPALGPETTQTLAVLIGLRIALAGGALLAWRNVRKRNRHSPAHPT